VEPLSTNPMTYYHLAMYLGTSSQQDKAKLLGKGIRCFPPIYASPMEMNPSMRSLRYIGKSDDATAYYLLGNALSNYQHEER
jgi:dolichyl-phosphate-mannose--protein O-mannosyl transferase